MPIAISNKIWYCFIMPYQKAHQKRQSIFFIKKFFQALHECAGAWKTKDHPRSSEKFIRSLRESKRI